jgi:hypothetical protein
MLVQQAVKYQEDRSRELPLPELSLKTLKFLSLMKPHLLLIKRMKLMFRLLSMRSGPS